MIFILFIFFSANEIVRCDPILYAQHCWPLMDVALVSLTGRFFERAFFYSQAALRGTAYDANKNCCFLRSLIILQCFLHPKLQ